MKNNTAILNRFGRAKNSPITFPLAFYVLGIVLAHYIPLHYSLYGLFLFYGLFILLMSMIRCDYSFKLKAVSFALIFLWLGAFRFGTESGKNMTHALADPPDPARVSASVKGAPKIKGQTTELESSIEYIEGVDERLNGAYRGLSLELKVYDRADDILKGDSVSFLARISKNVHFDNGMRRGSIYNSINSPPLKAALKSAFEIHKTGEANILEKALAESRKKISSSIEKSARNVPGQILKGILLGDKAALDAEVKNTFRACGLSHLLVVSGFHLSLVFVIFFYFLKYICRLSRGACMRFDINIAASCLALAPALFYMLLADCPYPTLRAGLMLSLAIVCALSFRQAIALNVYFLAIALLLLLDPVALYSVSFELSAVAVFGIIYGLAKIRPLYSMHIMEGRLTFRKKARLYLFDLILVTALAVSFTAPLSVYYFGRVSSVGFFVNLVIIPVYAFTVFPVGIVSMVASFFSPSLGAFLWTAPSWIIDKTYKFMELAAGFKLSTVGFDNFYIEHVIICYFALVLILNSHIILRYAIKQMRLYRPISFSKETKRNQH